MQRIAYPIHFAADGDPAGGAGGSSTLLSGQSSGSGDATQQSAASAPWSWAKEDGSLNEGWREKLGGELAGNASLKTITSLPDLAKSYVETKKLVGSKLEAPNEKSTPEQIAAWRKTVGAPDKPEGYLGEAKSLRPESVPESMWDVESEKKFLALAHKHHLPAATVKELLGFHAEAISSALKQSQEAEAGVLQAEAAKLKQAWGVDLEANINLATRVAQTVGLPKDHPVFTNADVVQAFAKLGKLFSEDKIVKGDATGITGTIQDRVKDITDPAGTSLLAREYRGEFGAERQAAAQRQLHQLLASQKSS